MQPPPSPRAPGRWWRPCSVRPPRPSRCPAALPAPALPADLLAALADAVGEASRQHRRRPAPAPHPRQVHARPAARPRGRPDRRARRRRPAGEPRRGRGRARARRRAPRGGGPVRRRHVRHRRPGRPPRRVLRRRQPRPRPADRGLRRPGLDDRRPRSRPPRPRGRGRPGRARRHAGPLPAVVRARLHRRLRRDPVERPGVGGVRTFRRAGRRPHGRHPDRHDDPRLRAGHRRRPRPAAAGARLRGGLRRDHLGDGAGPAGAGGEGLRGLALADLRRGGRRRAGDRPVRAPADRAPALRRGRVRRQPGRPERDRRAAAAAA